MDNISERQSDRFATFLQHESVENIVELILFNLGFKSNLQGTKFLVEAIVKMYTTQIHWLCKQLYPQIAEKYNTKGQRVERSIRHAIYECYASGNLVRANEMLGCQIVNNYPPTNSEFISSVCTWLRIEKTYVRSNEKKDC